MIAFLRGEVAAVDASTAFIDVNGVGFAVGMSANSLSLLPAKGERVELFTYMHVREDGMALYGFLTIEEKALFERLIGISGVGPKVALAALSFFSPQQLAEAIAAQDVARVSKIPGVGKKTAQRIILELKGTLETGGSLFAQEAQPEKDLGRAGASEALLSMGFTQAEIELALKGAPEMADESVLLQHALKRLGSL